MDNELKIERQIYISAPAEKVWDAIVTPELASRYFVVPLLQCDQKPGGRIIYGSPEAKIMNCEVLEYEQGKRLVHMFGYIPEEPLSRVTYEVESIGDMCRLTLTHDGFASGSKTYQEVNGGWPGILANLKMFVETGEVMSQPAGAGTVSEGDIVHEIDLEASADKVYEALTTPEGIRGWWSLNSDIGMGVGAAHELRFKKEGRDVVMSFHIEELDPGRRVVWQCVENSNPAWKGTYLSWTIEPRDNGSHLRFEHTGFSDPASPAVKMSAEGWAHFMKSLESYVDRGTGMPW